MKSYVVLLRGVNVGGNSKVSMAELKACLEELGFANVSTYIASGNVFLQSKDDPKTVKKRIEAALVKTFKLDEVTNKVLVLDRSQLEKIINTKPKGFGEQPGMYHSDVIFLIDIDVAQTMPVFTPREGVDTVWPGVGAVYSQRLSAMRTKSRLSKMMVTPQYKSMTIRTWNTTVKLLEILKKLESGAAK